MELEGSQRFRQRLALSCISGKSFALKNVRLMDTEKPGLNQYEADILRLIDELSDGMTVIIDKKTLTSMKFTPGLLLGCHEGKSFTCSKERGLSYYIEFLIMLGPFCKKGVDIVLKGVTDHPADLCVDTLKSGGEKILKKCGLEMFIVIEKRGMLPDGGGRVRVSVSPVTKLEPIKLVYAGNVKAIKGTAWATNTSSLFASRMGESCRRVFRPVIHHVEIYSDLVRGDRCGKSQGYGISLTAETMKGFGYTADGFVDRTNFVKGKTKLTAAVKRISELPTEMGESVEEELDGPEILAEQVGAKLLARILDQGICDSCFQWVPLFFMALSEEYGVSKVRRFVCCQCSSGIDGAVRL